ncbi:hypothetical protein BKA69DRAFT_1039704 [Paraphysoderma sedebokerense]|nr:hypothetical protein BKA69DRAFT_1039704 [Paraphysoderma sedebokerense]
MSSQPKVDFYYSSVSGNLMIKKNTAAIERILDSYKISHTKIDLANDEFKEQKEHYRKLCSGKLEIPGVVINGAFKGGYKEFEAAQEDEALDKFFEIEGFYKK